MLSFFFGDRALRGFEGARSISTPCRGTLLEGTFARRIYPRSSHPTRSSVLLSIRSVSMGSRNVVVQEPRPEHPTWHVQFYDLLIP